MVVTFVCPKTDQQLPDVPLEYLEQFQLYSWRLPSSPQQQTLILPEGVDFQSMVFITQFMGEYMRDRDENARRLLALETQKPLMTTELSTLVPAWCLSFLAPFSVQRGSPIYPLLKSTHVLGFRPLLLLLAAYIVVPAKGNKTPDDLQSIYNVDLNQMPESEKQSHIARMKEFTDELKRNRARKKPSDAASTAAINEEELVQDYDSIVKLIH